MLAAALLSLSLAAVAAPPSADILPHREVPPSTMMHTALHPLGFSADGRLAVLRIPPDEAVGCFLWELEIINLVDDKVLAEERWDEASCEATPDLKALWAQKGAAFRRLMRAHGIEAGAVPLQAFPLQHGGQRYTAWLVAQPPERVEADGLETFRVPMEVRVQGPAGEKAVGTVHVEMMGDMPMSWGYEIVGCLKSPHEDRVALVVRGVQRGWEGLPYVETVDIIGASLSSGF